MVNVVVFINVRPLQYFFSLAQKLPAFLLVKIIVDLRITQKPLGFCLSFLLYLFGSQLVDEVELDGYK
jgi:hypothetical protein